MLRGAFAVALVGIVACSRAPASAVGPSLTHDVAEAPAGSLPKDEPDLAYAPDPVDAAAGPLSPTPPQLSSAAELPSVDSSGVYLGRKLAPPMSYRGADWLDRPHRDAVQQPEHVLDVLGVHEGQTVADLGCGSGYFTVHLAKRVGSRGRVYATDLQEEMLRLLAKKLTAQKIANVTPERTTVSDAKLPEGALDLVLLVDVYHELPDPTATLAQIKRSLTSTGRLALVEYRAEDPKLDIKPEHKTTLVQLQRELAANGWTLVDRDESLPQQRIVVFRPAM